VAARSYEPAHALPGVQLDTDSLLVHPDLTAPPRLALWRAPTDNDRLGGMAERWRAQGLDRLTRSVIGVDRESARTVVKATWHTGVGTAIDHVQTFTPVLFHGGRSGLLVEESATIPPELADLPRVGTVFEVAADLTWVDWFGAGPWETYPDRRACGEVGGFGASVDSWFTPYPRPQESGGRSGVRWFCLSAAGTGGPGMAGGLAVHLDTPRQVSLARFSAEDLAAAAHPDELLARPSVVVHLDAAHRGVGTAACGPDTLPPYRLAPGTYRWSWTLVTSP
jgi:beta-galactosidase